MLLQCIAKNGVGLVPQCHGEERTFTFFTHRKQTLSVVMCLDSFPGARPCGRVGGVRGGRQRGQCARTRQGARTCAPAAGQRVHGQWQPQRCRSQGVLSATRLCPLWGVLLCFARQQCDAAHTFLALLSPTGARRNCRQHPGVATLDAEREERWALHSMAILATLTL